MSLGFMAEVHVSGLMAKHDAVNKYRVLHVVVYIQSG